MRESARTGRARGAARVVLAAVAAVLMLACARETELPEALGEQRCNSLRIVSPPPDANLILVLNDTMRRDFPGIYGGPAKTPNLDEFAEANLTFDEVVTQAPWTKPSVATLFTSLYPSQHRLADDPQMRSVEDGDREGPVMETDVLASSLVTLAEVLRDEGLRTAAFVSNPWMEGRFGFGQGFEVYDDSFARWGSDGQQVIDAGLAWLATLEPGERYFLYLHFIDSHRPYGRLPDVDVDALRARLNSGTPIAAREGLAFSKAIRLADGTRARDAGFVATTSLLRAAYRRGIEDFDEILGRLLEQLRVRPEWERTAVIITSDHGEALFRRGWGNHGLGLFEDETTVPLVARLPGVVPDRGRVDCLAGLVDVMPSVCRYLDAECPASAQGWSFLALPGESATDERRYLVTEGVMGAPGNRSLRNRRFKLVFQPQLPGDGGKRNGSLFSLFDLDADPLENFDRLQAPYSSEQMERVFAAFRAALPVAVAELPAPERSSAKIDAELRERLEALGYGE